MHNRIKAGLSALLILASLSLADAASAAPPSAPTPSGVTLESKPLAGNKIMKKVPPRGNVSSRTTVTCGSPCYKWATATQTGISATTTGAEATMSIHAPAILSYDSHTLAELGVFGTNSGDLVEAGWTVDPGQFGNSNPHFFVFSWINGVPQGYGTGFVLAAGRPISPGDTVVSGTSMTPRWTYFGVGCGCTAGWWMSYGGAAAWVGVYPDNAGTWNGSFVRADTVSVWGEVALGYDPSQTDMGNGQLAAAAQGATVSGYNLFGSAPSAPSLASSGAGGNNAADRYGLVFNSATAFRYGGPGGTETIVGSVTADDCKGVGTGSNPSGRGSFCTYNSNPGLVPTGKVTEIDGSASTSVCRGNIGTSAGYAAISNIAIATYNKVVWFRDGACAGASQIYNHGRLTLPAGWTNLADASYKLSATLATCATGYPGTPPTC